MKPKLRPPKILSLLDICMSMCMVFDIGGGQKPFGKIRYFIFLTCIMALISLLFNI